ncbi:hypothetical protein MAR_015818 [Mya arenaria]|uniref:Uncharacterized protein n=1 Tax=Mya arenaria TaxID=6604 RepID=A0ABY7FLV9_MYAAR|nr:hypothetical protein MAR_015818 [Mya arenaria]
MHNNPLKRKAAPKPPMTSVGCVVMSFSCKRTCVGLDDLMDSVHGREVMASFCKRTFVRGFQFFNVDFKLKEIIVAKMAVCQSSHCLSGRNSYSVFEANKKKRKLMYCGSPLHDVKGSDDCLVEKLLSRT